MKISVGLRPGTPWMNIASQPVVLTRTFRSRACIIAALSRSVPDLPRVPQPPMHNGMAARFLRIRARWRRLLASISAPTIITATPS